MTGVLELAEDTELVYLDAIKHYLMFCNKVIVKTKLNLPYVKESDRVKINKNPRGMVLECNLYRRIAAIKIEATSVFKVFYGYITHGATAPYVEGSLVDLKRGWGPEYEIWSPITKNGKPQVSGEILVKDFSRCLSLEASAFRETTPLGRPLYSWGAIVTNPELHMDATNDLRGH